MEYTFCNSFFAHSSGLRFAKKSKIYVLLIMLILILISARLWWARGELYQNCEIFGIFGRFSEHDFGQFTLYMISGSLRFINSEALFEKKSWSYKQLEEIDWNAILFWRLVFDFDVKQVSSIALFQFLYVYDLFGG